MPADFNADDFAAEEGCEGWAYALGGDDRAEAVWEDFDVPNEDVVQTWQLELTDAASTTSIRAPRCLP